MNDQPRLQEKCPETEERRPEPAITNRLLKQRIVMLTGEIEREMAQRIIAQLLVLSEESKDPIKLFINSPGGDADSGYAMYDVIRFIDAPVQAICTGLAASAAVIVLLACPKERRLSLPNARFLIHQPSTGIRGSAADIQIEASEILKLREAINKLIAEECKQSVEKVAKDTHRNYWMGAKEAKEYGLLGKVITNIREI